jgi:SAM-dependent methyltransferase
MALAYPNIVLLLEIKRSGILNDFPHPSILELGEQNWYGDVSPEQIRPLIDEFVNSSEAREELNKELDLILKDSHDSIHLFHIAKLFYKTVFSYEKYTSIDFHGTDSSLRFDLNSPLPIDDTFDMVTNIGTAEHIFNVAQVFRTMHERTKPGGLMIHSLPNQGCYDHGFYNFNPTFIFDLAAQNFYDILGIYYVQMHKQSYDITKIESREQYVEMAVSNKLSTHSGLATVLRKALIPTDFQVPQQGFYDNRLSPALREAWNSLPR